MNIGCDILLAEEVDEDFRIGCGDFFAIEPLNAGVLHLFRYGERESALAESEAAYHLHLLLLFEHLVKSHNAYVGSACGYRIGDIVVAEKK